MENERISVVVPVYNVESYLKRCVDSIIHQTYSNLEIFLVDDGSTDASGALCDAYAEQDQRIVCIHKKNGGLSSARNMGIERAAGKFLFLVDSDDFVDERMIEVLYRDLTEQNVKMSAVSFQEFTDIADIRKSEEKIPVQCLTQKEAVKKILKGEEFCDYAWNKLYRRELFETVRYPIDRMMEDVGTTYRLLEQCEQVSYRPMPLYFYYQRADSILHRRSLKFYEDKFDMGLERYQEIQKLYPEMLENDASMLRTIEHCYPYLFRDAERKAQMERFLKEFRSTALELLDSSGQRKYRLMQLSRGLYTKLFLLKNGSAADGK